MIMQTTLFVDGASGRGDGNLGFDQFAVAGHDRGARTAFRMALDNLTG